MGGQSAPAAGEGKSEPAAGEDSSQRLPPGRTVGVCRRAGEDSQSLPPGRTESVPDNSHASPDGKSILRTPRDFKLLSRTNSMCSHDFIYIHVYSPINRH